jgi:hypothetical protein
MVHPSVQKKRTGEPTVGSPVLDKCHVQSVTISTWENDVSSVLCTKAKAELARKHETVSGRSDWSDGRF